MTALREKHNMQHNSKAVNIIINVEVKEFHPVRTAGNYLIGKDQGSGRARRFR